MRIAKPAYSKLLSWLSARAILAELEALDSRTLLDIGLNRHELHAAADLTTPFERGVTLHEVRARCETLRMSPRPGPVAAAKDR
jgi:uncharacterized protein YjiS (DUF1127 family)